MVKLGDQGWSCSLLLTLMVLNSGRSTERFSKYSLISTHKWNISRDHTANTNSELSCRFCICDGRSIRASHQNWGLNLKYGRWTLDSPFANLILINRMCGILPVGHGLRFLVESDDGQLQSVLRDAYSPSLNKIGNKRALFIFSLSRLIICPEIAC